MKYEFDTTVIDKPSAEHLEHILDVVRSAVKNRIPPGNVDDVIQSAFVEMARAKNYARWLAIAAANSQVRLFYRYNYTAKRDVREQVQLGEWHRDTKATMPDIDFANMLEENPTLRLQLEGYSNYELPEILGVSQATVDRRVAKEKTKAARMLS